MSVDKRLQYLVDNISSLCQLSDTEALLKDISKSKEAVNFLDDPKLLCLKVSILKGNTFGRVGFGSAGPRCGSDKMMRIRIRNTDLKSYLFKA
jgi:hypothetical protein